MGTSAAVVCPEHPPDGGVYVYVDSDETKGGLQEGSTASRSSLCAQTAPTYGRAIAVTCPEWSSATASSATCLASGAWDTALACVACPFQTCLPAAALKGPYANARPAVFAFPSRYATKLPLPCEDGD